MKWFERLVNRNDENFEKPSFEDPIEEEKEPEVKPKEEPKKEMIDVEISGTHSYHIIEEEETVRFGHGCDYTNTNHYIEFKYDIVAKFLGEEANFKSSVTFRIEEGERRRSPYMYNFYSKEKAYEYLHKLTTEEEGMKRVMDRIKDSIECNVREYARQQKLDRIKKELKEGEKLDLNLIFQMEKPKDAQ